MNSDSDISGVTVHAARKSLAAHRRGEHDETPDRNRCRVCRADVNHFLRYGVGLSDSELRLLEGSR